VPDRESRPAAHILRGTVALHGRRESLAAQAWRAILAVAVRESGS
jgi:hypothetical protein